MSDWKTRGLLLCVGAAIAGVAWRTLELSDAWLTVAIIAGLIGFGMFVVGRLEDSDSED
jgi:hypothetical protein